MFFYFSVNDKTFSTDGTKNIHTYLMKSHSFPPWKFKRIYIYIKKKIEFFSLSMNFVGS